MRHDDHARFRAEHDAASEGLGRPEDAIGPDDLGRPEDPENPEPLEPEIDPDSRVLEDLESPEHPHEATRTDAGTGQGTVSGPPYDDATQDRPILDGSTQDDRAEASVPNPYRGETDPAAIHRQPALNSTSTDRWLIASVIAGIVVSGVLLLLLQWNPLWCGIGITVALVGLLLVLAVRASRLGRAARLRVEAILLAIIWLVPLAIIVAVLITSAGEIW